MSGWLDPVRRTLTTVASPITVFFRDDDAGWEDDQLLRLLDIAASFGAPIALAAIPLAIGPRLAAELRERLVGDVPLISVHQHGFAHVNHEASGRKCEFGPSRARELQRRDVADGRQRLQQAFGAALSPVFTPPWNRCTRDTAECLAELGFTVLSRDASAERFGGEPLHELPVDLDWSGPRGARQGAATWGQTIARVLGSGRTTGFMLHHAVMTADDRRMLGELLEVLAEHSHVTARQMLDIRTASHVSGGIPSCSF
jgi:hypothetical protein